MYPSMSERVDNFIYGKFGKCADKYFNSVFYIITLAAVCILSHTFDLIMYCIPIMAVLLALSLVFSKNTFVLIPFLLLCTFCMSETASVQSGFFDSPARIAVFSVFLAVAVAGFAFHIVYYKKWKLIFKKAYLSCSLAIVSGVLLVGGFGAQSFSIRGALLAASVAACMFFPYTLLVNCGEYEKDKTVGYFICAVIAGAVVIGCAVFQQYAVNDFDLVSPKKFLFFGYAVSNSAAAFVVIALPLTFYFVYKLKYGCLLMALVALELTIITFTFSRASLLVALPGVIIVATALCFLKKNGKIGYWIVYGLTIAAGVIIVGLLAGNVFGNIDKILHDFMDSSGRIELWKRGFDEWKRYPMFGVGLGFLLGEGYGYWSFHCEPLTYFFCCGLVGICALCYHRYKLGRLIFSTKLNAERAFVALAVIAMLFNALLDTAMTSPAHLLYYAVMLVIIERDAMYGKASTCCLPIGISIARQSNGKDSVRHSAVSKGE